MSNKLTRLNKNDACFERLFKGQRALLLLQTSFSSIEGMKNNLLKFVFYKGNHHLRRLIETIQFSVSVVIEVYTVILQTFIIQKMAPINREQLQNIRTLLNILSLL